MPHWCRRGTALLTMQTLSTDENLGFPFSKVDWQARRNRGAGGLCHIALLMSHYPFANDSDNILS